MAVGGGLIKLGVGRAGAGNPWWDPLGEGLCIWGAWQPKGAASFAASLVDLSGNGHDLVDPGGPNTPGWTAPRGWIFDGVNDYLASTFIPQNDQTQSMAIQYDAASTGTGSNLCGMTDGASRQFVLAWVSGARYRNGGNVNGVANQATANLCVAGNQGYLNGAAEGGAIGAWAGAAASVVDIGRIRNYAFYIVADVWAFALYDCTLTAPQVARVAAAMAAV